MKRFLLSIILSLVFASSYAIGYEEARERAWFLTDKMAYELNLTPEQYDRAYQINLDYLMNMRSPSDCYGSYWSYRDSDLRCILYDWQYNLYASIDYFFRPIIWERNAWYYPIVRHYRPGYFYFSRPGVFLTYRGGMWNRRGHNSPSPYIGLRPNRGFGMRDRYQSHGSYPDRPGMVDRGGQNRPGYPQNGWNNRQNDRNNNQNGWNNRQNPSRPDNRNGFNPGNNRDNNRNNTSTGRNNNRGTNNGRGNNSGNATPPTGNNTNSSRGRSNTTTTRPQNDNSGRNFFQRGGNSSQSNRQSGTRNNSSRGSARGMRSI